MRLTTKRLIAMEEALIFRLAGEIGDEIEVSLEDYDTAHSWVCEQLGKRRLKTDQS